MDKEDYINNMNRIRNNDIMNNDTKIKNPMELYSEKTGKHINDEFKYIIEYDLYTNDERVQRLYELFCELHGDWVQSKVFK